MGVTTGSDRVASPQCRTVRGVAGWPMTRSRGAGGELDALELDAPARLRARCGRGSGARDHAGERVRRAPLSADIALSEESAETHLAGCRHRHRLGSLAPVRVAALQGPARSCR